MKLVEKYTEKYTFEQWESLITELKGSKNFKHKVKSSPGDIQKNVYVVLGSTATNRYDDNNYAEKICIVTVENAIHIEVMATTSISEIEPSIKDPYVKAIIGCLFNSTIEEMPLYINDRDEIIRRICTWRLRNDI